MISMIAAVGKNRELGKNNDLIWSLSEDKKFFRSTTLSHTVVMGRKTFESLGGLLPKRRHVVLTSNKSFHADGVDVVHGVSDVTDEFAASEEECFIIGGGEIYTLFLPYAERIYLTEIDDVSPDAEVFFPEFDKSRYSKKLISEIEENGIHAEIKLYTRI